MTPTAAFTIVLFAAALVAPTEVVWLKKPTGDQLPSTPTDSTAFWSGRVELDCRILASGLLDDCKVVVEEPGDHGRGAWAIKVATLFQAAPLSKSGVPVAGRRITIPIRFDPPSDEPQAEPAPQ